jgi:hypothetical protein
VKNWFQRFRAREELRRREERLKLGCCAGNGEVVDVMAISCT